MTERDALLEAMTQVEPAIKAAGDEALRRQSSAVSSMKSDTGSVGADIVTDADIAVQEMLLNALSQTDLRHCTMMAEEATRGTEAFLGDWPFVVTIDPIDGTKLYADGSRYFNTIVTLHDRKTVLRVFRYYPALGITFRIDESSVQQGGTWPPIEEIDPSWQQHVIYVSAASEPDMEQVRKELAARNLALTRFHEIHRAVGCSPLFLTGAVGGYFCGHPNVYDGTTTLAYARAKGWPVIARGEHGQGEFDLSRTFVGENDMLRYRGYYYVLRPEVP